MLDPSYLSILRHIDNKFCIEMTQRPNDIRNVKRMVHGYQKGKIIYSSECFWPSSGACCKSIRELVSVIKKEYVVKSAKNIVENYYSAHNIWGYDNNRPSIYAQQHITGYFYQIIDIKGDNPLHIRRY